MTSGPPADREGQDEENSYDRDIRDEPGHVGDRNAVSRLIEQIDSFHPACLKERTFWRVFIDSSSPAHHRGGDPRTPWGKPLKLRIEDGILLRKTTQGAGRETRRMPLFERVGFHELEKLDPVFHLQLLVDVVHVILDGLL